MKKIIGFVSVAGGDGYPKNDRIHMKYYNSLICNIL